MKKLVLALILVCAVLMHPRAANAAITASLMMNIPNPYTGPCPVTVTFSGDINGPAGTSVTYYFSHFVNGSSTATSPTNGKIPTSGSLPISETLTIDSAHSGFQSNEVDVTSPQITQSKIFFTITCGAAPTPTPTPTAAPAGGPTGLTNTTSQTVCGQHGGLAGLFCPDALHNGYLVLVWNYANQSGIDGYHVYQTDHGQHTQVDNQVNNQVTVSFLKPTSAGFLGNCYVVNPYKNGADLAPSNTFCMPSKYSLGPVKLGQNLSPNMTTLSLFRWDYRVNDYTCFGCLGGEYGKACLTPCVGWETYKSGDGPSLNHEITVWRSYLAFNWTIPLHNLNVYKATVNLTIAPNSDQGCYGGIAPALAQWEGNKDWVQGDFTYNEPHTINGPTFSIDVTSIVRDWASGKVRNFGFVMSGSNETGSEPDNAACILNFNNGATLTIEHY